MHQESKSHNIGKEDMPCGIPSRERQSENDDPIFFRGELITMMRSILYEEDEGSVYAGSAFVQS